MAPRIIVVGEVVVVALSEIVDAKGWEKQKKIKVRLKIITLIAVVIKRINFHFFDPIEIFVLLNLTAKFFLKRTKELQNTLFDESEYFYDKRKRAGHLSLYCRV